MSRALYQPDAPRSLTQQAIAIIASRFYDAKGNAALPCSPVASHMSQSSGISAVRRTVGARTGGRSERVVREIIRATVGELARVGYAALRVDDVAAHAGVNKTTVYRRWPTKADLVAAAVRTVAGIGEPLPDTGTVRGDLLELVRRALGFVSSPEGRAIARIVTIELGDPEVDRLARALRDEMLSRRVRVVERATARGELPADVDARLVIDAVFAPVMSRVVRFGEQVDERTLTRLVDMVLTGANHTSEDPEEFHQDADVRATCLSFVPSPGARGRIRAWTP
jgi:AcrR family transcriptional regulator